jgi:hypothetical protein
MNTGQSMLVLGAFAMMSVLSLNLNRMMFSSMLLGLEMEAMTNAISVGQSMLDEILSKSFDERTANNEERLYDPSQATPQELFGPDGSEEEISGIDTLNLSKTRFDDVDDYHLYRRQVWDQRLGWFFVIDSVHYVHEDLPDVRTSSQTFYKSITVAVWNSQLPKVSESSSEVQPIVLRDIAVYRRYF